MVVGFHNTQPDVRIRQIHIEHLRTLYPSTAIVISTGYGEVDPALMLRAKITGYLAKPYDRETLMASLERAMESRRAGDPPVH